MKVVTLRDARARLSSVIDDANTERVLITSHGRPAALVIGVRGQDEEEVMLVSNPRFWEMIEESRNQDRTEISGTAGDEHASHQWRLRARPPARELVCAAASSTPRSSVISLVRSRGWLPTKKP